MRGVCRGLREAGAPADSGAVERYFSRVYPPRSRVAGMLQLRGGEDRRLALVRRWVPRCDGLSILDAGCGDGAFLHRALTGRPSRLRLEDVSAVQLGRAVERLRDRADTVEAQVADVRAPPRPSCFDVVLALGVADYVADWPSLVRALLARAAGPVIADFPRRGHPRHVVRRWWLALHGIHLHTAFRVELAAVLSDCGAWGEIVPLPLHWMVRLGPRPCGEP